MTNHTTLGCRFFRHKIRGDEEVNIPILLATRGKNAHGFIMWMQNGKPEREEVALDFPTKEVVPIEEFRRRKMLRADENRRKHPFPGCLGEKVYHRSRHEFMDRCFRPE